jgi:site-specific DNA-methyltransferase (adenine-specific)
MKFETDKKADMIYADCMYMELNFNWITKYWEMLKPNGIFQVQTDYHTVAQIKIFMDNLENSNFVNWVIYKQEWGGTPRKGFPQKHDDILIYSKGKDFYWDKLPIEIPKKTAGTKFDKKGTGLKTPCSVFDDLGNFSTMSKERIKNPETGRNIEWQKSMALMNRLLLPFTLEGDLIIDPFLGSGTTAEWCKNNNRNCIGIEMDVNKYNIAKQRIR